MRPATDLRETQLDIVGSLYERNACLIVAGMGGGKTAAFLHAYADLVKYDNVGRCIMIAPPLPADTVWPKEPDKWVDTAHLKVASGMVLPKKRMELLTHGDWDIFTLSCYSLKWLWDNRKHTPDDVRVIAVDETSFFKDPRGANSKLLRRLGKLFDFRYGLTGTMRPNGYQDAWAQMKFIAGEDFWPPFDEWRRRNFMPMDPKGYTWEVHDFRARQLDRDMAPYVHVFDINLNLPGLSEGPDHDVYFDLPPKAREKYEEMMDDFVTEVDKLVANGVDEEQAVVVALSAGVASGKLSQIAQGYLYDEGENIAELHTGKRDALRDLDLSIGDEPALIWYGYKQDIEDIRAALGDKRAPLIGGGVSPKRKRELVEEFSKGNIRRLILHPASAAHGVDGLQHGGRRHVWYCPTWSAEQYAQAIKRLDRPGQQQPVFSHQIVANDTVDIVKTNRVAYKMADEAAWRKFMQSIRDRRN